MKFVAMIDGGNGGSTNLVADSMADAMVEAIEWANSGDWPECEGTFWVELSVKAENGEQQDKTVAIEPEPPACIDGEHDWQSPHDIVGGLKENPGVFGNGGGVRINECCIKCGCRKLTDTWATNPETGQQGLRGVAYYPGDYVEALNARKG